MRRHKHLDDAVRLVNLESGFTLAEISIATVILVMAVAMAMSGLVYVLRAAHESNVQTELDIDVQIAMERLKHDLRLTALDKIFYYPPGSGPYTAISFPMARDDDGDGAVEVDNVGKINWDQTYIYHVWPAKPNQLRLTIFDPRDNTLSDAQRQEQLNSVVQYGHGSNTYNGANARTHVIFENLFDWDINPRFSRYDGYAPTLTRDRGVILGSCIISNGFNTFEFRVVDKNSSSSGYKIGLDKLFMSPSYSPREAENQLPVHAQSGASATPEYMVGGSWSGNYQLMFPATAVGHYFTLRLANDRWEETNFRETGSYMENATILFDQTLTPYDFVLKVDTYTNELGATNYWTNAMFISQVIDTQITYPTYTEIEWDAVCPPPTRVTLQVRTASKENMFDAPDWAMVPIINAPGTIAPGNGRYLQFRANLIASPGENKTPTLKNVTIKWRGEMRVIDIGGTFTKGPDYGIWELKVNGQTLTTGLSIYLKIFRDALGFLGNKRFYSELTSEVQPRNTGK